MSNALKKITTRAKQLKRSHPNAKWTSLIKQAGAEYRRGHKSTPKRKKRKIGGEPASRSVVPQIGSVKKKYEFRGSPALLKMSPEWHKKQAREQILYRIGDQLRMNECTRMRKGKGWRGELKRRNKLIAEMREDYRKLL